MFNEQQPGTFTPPGRIIVIGDVHGDTQRFMQCLYAAKVMNSNLEWIAEPRDTIVMQLGDQIDSKSRGGAPSWEKLPDIEMIYLTDRLDAIARAHGGRVVSLLGNHEVMNAMGDFTFVSEKSLEIVPTELRAKMFQPGGTISHILSKRNVIVKIGTYVFCHGGIIPMHFPHMAQHHRVNQVTSKFFKRLPLTQDEMQLFRDLVVSESGVLWTRAYVDLAQNNIEVLKDILKEMHQVMGTRKIFVGHNTVPEVSMIADGMLVFADVGISRSYPFQSIQFIEITAPDTPQEEMRVVRIDMEK